MLTKVTLGPHYGNVIILKKTNVVDCTYECIKTLHFYVDQKLFNGCRLQQEEIEPESRQIIEENEPTQIAFYHYLKQRLYRQHRMLFPELYWILEIECMDQIHHSNIPVKRKKCFSEIEMWSLFDLSARNVLVVHVWTWNLDRIPSFTFSSEYFKINVFNYLTSLSRPRTVQRLQVGTRGYWTRVTSHYWREWTGASFILPLPETETL